MVLLFVYAPIFSLVLFSFNATKSNHLGGFSFEWYGEYLDQRNYERRVWTFIIAILAHYLGYCGTFAAIGLSKNKKFIRNVVIT